MFPFFNNIIEDIKPNLQSYALLNNYTPISALIGVLVRTTSKNYKNPSYLFLSTTLLYFFLNIFTGFYSILSTLIAGFFRFHHSRNRRYSMGHGLRGNVLSLNDRDQTNNNIVLYQEAQEHYCMSNSKA